MQILIKNKSSGKNCCILLEFSEVSYKIYKNIGIKIGMVPFELE